MARKKRKQNRDRQPHTAPVLNDGINVIIRPTKGPRNATAEVEPSPTRNVLAGTTSEAPAEAVGEE